MNSKLLQYIKLMATKIIKIYGKIYLFRFEFINNLYRIKKYFIILFNN